MNATHERTNGRAIGRFGAKMIAAGALAAAVSHATPPSMVTINATGTGCAAAGVWHAAERRCQFTSDVGGIDIQADDVIVDCAGHAVAAFYGQRAVGITASDRSRVTIRNCYVSSFDDGIRVANFHDGRIEDNIVDSSRTIGIAIAGSHRNHIVNNRGYGNDFIIVMGSSDHNIVQGNSGDDQNGMVITKSNYNTFRFNFVQPSANFGMQIFDSSFNRFESSGVYFAPRDFELGGEQGFDVDGGQGNEIVDCSVEGAINGVRITHSPQTVFADNVVKEVRIPVQIQSSDGVTFERNDVFCGRANFSADENVRTCVSVRDTSDGHFAANVITNPAKPEDIEMYGVSGTAIEIVGGARNRVEGTTFENWDTGVWISDSDDAVILVNEMHHNRIGVQGESADRMFVIGNVMTNNQYGMYAAQGEQAGIAWNVMADGVFGPIVSGGSQHIFYDNEMYRMESAAMLASGVAESWFIDNMAAESGAGIAAFGDRNVVHGNDVSNNAQGMLVIGEGSKIQLNVANDSTRVGFVDYSRGDGTGGTANQYWRNRCERSGVAGSDPGGLCRE